jgi:hypothetical protein
MARTKPDIVEKRAWWGVYRRVSSIVEARVFGASYVRVGVLWRLQLGSLVLCGARRLAGGPA